MTTEQLRETVHIDKLICTCDSVPVQLEGTLTNGWFIYARSRHSKMSIGIGTTHEAAVAVLDDPTYYLEANISVASKYDTCSQEQLRVVCQLFVSMIVWE